MKELILYALVFVAATILAKFLIKDIKRKYNEDENIIKGRFL